MTAAERHSLRLAVADDERDFREVVRRVAEPLGWEIAEYAHGRELLTGIERLPLPDLILLDLVMPQLDGIETIGWLAANTIRVPIILVTGRLPIYADVAETLARAKGLTILDVLQKPAAVSRLRRALDPARFPAPPG